MFVKREVGHELRELPTLRFQLLESAQFGNTHTGKLLLPAIKGLLTDAPSLRQTSPTGVPASTCRKAFVICSSVKFFFSSVPPFQPKILTNGMN